MEAIDTASFSNKELLTEAIAQTTSANNQGHELIPAEFWKLQHSYSEDMLVHL